MKQQQQLEEMLSVLVGGGERASQGGGGELLFVGSQVHPTEAAGLVVYKTTTACYSVLFSARHAHAHTHTHTHTHAFLTLSPVEGGDDQFLLRERRETKT